MIDASGLMGPQVEETFIPFMKVAIPAPLMKTLEYTLSQCSTFLAPTYVTDYSFRHILESSDQQEPVNLQTVHFVAAQE